jgi:hypothetical protein
MRKNGSCEQVKALQIDLGMNPTSFVTRHDVQRFFQVEAKNRLFVTVKRHQVA